ncbi:hypothetical protein D3C72_866620 [compost metagenome]
MTVTAPPEKSPGRSGEAVLLMMIFSMRFDGIISNEKAFLSGSVLGKIVLLSAAVL